MKYFFLLIAAMNESSHSIVKILLASGANIEASKEVKLIRL